MLAKCVKPPFATHEYDVDALLPMLQVVLL
jgi:hypothetical protein